MAKNNRDVLKENDALRKENAMLQQHLKEAMHSIDALKSGNVDALVIARAKSP